jgi:hypothetical protein
VCCVAALLLNQMQHATKAADTRTAQRSITLNSLESTLSIKVAAAAEHLAAHGWAVVPGVLSKEECQQYEQGVWDWLARLGNNIRYAAALVRCL